MKKQIFSYILFLLGLSIFLYPHITMVLNEAHFKEEISNYNQDIKTITELDRIKHLETLHDYNNKMASNKVKTKEYLDPFAITDNEVTVNSTEDTSSLPLLSKDIFGYIEIPKINEKLPIYLGATKSNLSKGVAQIEKTSLPIGGIGTHSVLAGHRGYRGATFFRYIDQLEVGDLFYIYVYGDTLSYEVTGRDIIEPNQTEKLEIDPNKDQITLLSCHPYRISTHRILIYSKRVEKEISNELNKDSNLNIDNTEDNYNHQTEVVSQEQLLTKDWDHLNMPRDTTKEVSNNDILETVKNSSIIKSLLNNESQSNARIYKLLSHTLVICGSFIWFLVFIKIIRCILRIIKSYRKKRAS